MRSSITSSTHGEERFPSLRTHPPTVCIRPLILLGLLGRSWRVRPEARIYVCMWYSPLHGSILHWVYIGSQQNCVPVCACVDRFVPLSMHCQYASVIVPICVHIAIICFWAPVIKGAKSWIHVFFNSPCNKCVTVWHWQDRSVCILPTKRLTTHMLRSLQCHHYASSDIILSLPFVWGVPYVW